MGLPGKAIEKISEAIKSAFTGRDKLVMMLRTKLDIEESDIPNNSDYNQVVFDLITKLEREGRVPDLIKGALREVPGNSELQNLPEILIQLINEKFIKKDDDGLGEIHQEVNVIFLYVILLKLASSHNNLINQIKRIYFKCCSEKLYEDWEDTIHNTIAEILSNLQKISQNSDMEPIIQFAACLLESLLEQEKNHNLKLEQLKSWVQNNVNDYSALLTTIRNNNTSRSESDIIPSHLIILINPSQQHQNQRYFISAWFIYDGRNDEFNYQTAKGYKPLEIQHQEQETFSLAEISSLLDDYIDQITTYLYDSSAHGQPTIEIFLPYELLNEPIDTWNIKIDDDFLRPIGVFYQVIVRSTNRLNKKYKFRNVWVQKWNTLNKLTENNYSQYFISGEFSSCDELMSKINKDSSIALILVKPPPTQEYFKVINATGIPVALWFRQELNISNFKDEINNLIECLITELPKKVKEQRSSDFSSDCEERIGHHLSLLWENPYIIPPSSINYTTP